MTLRLQYLYAAVVDSTLVLPHLPRHPTKECRSDMGRIPASLNIAMVITVRRIDQHPSGHGVKT